MMHAITLGTDGVLQPGRVLWLRSVLWGILLMFLLGVVVTAGVLVTTSVLAGVPVDQVMGLPGPDLLMLTIVWSLLTVGVYLGLVMLGEKRRPDELSLREAPVEILAGLGIGAAMMALVVLLLWAGGWVTLTRAQVTAVLPALAMSIESGIVEEVTFRLVALRLLWRAFGPVAALALSALFFGLVHLMNPNANWFAAICIAIEAGIMLAGFYILTGRIWVSIGVHAGWNFTQGWIFGAAVSGTSLFEGGPLNLEAVQGVPAFLSGGAFGPEASLAGLLVGTGVGAVTLWMARRRGRFDNRDRRADIFD